MDEYLSEKEQIEQIKQWWSENGWYLIGGALLAALGWFGYNQYQSWQDRQAEQAGTIYEELKLALDDDDRAGADALLAQLAADYPSSAYTDQARFLVAESNLVRDTDRAIAELEAVVEQSRDAGIAGIARFRLARVLAYDEQYERALEVLNVADAGAFDAAYSEIRGDIHAATGNLEAALAAYTDALLGGSDGTVNRELVQLKINDLILSAPPASDSGAELEAAPEAGAAE